MADEKKKTRRLFDDWIPDEAIDHAHAARDEMRQSFESFLPPGLVEHRRAAQREMLLAMRSVIDSALGRMESAKKK